MLPKEPSSTTSLKSVSNKLKNPLETPVQFIKGVGPRLGSIFANRGIHTVYDLLFFLPRAYEDRSKLLAIKELKDGIKATLAVEVLSSKNIPIKRTGKTIFEVRVKDSSGVLSLKWFHTPKGMEGRFHPGQQILVTGTPKHYLGKIEITHPEITWSLSSDAALVHTGRVVPIYTEIEGVPNRTLRSVLWQAIQKFLPLLKDDLPDFLLKKHSLPPISKALRVIHFPEEADQKSDSELLEKLIHFGTLNHVRLIYDEFFKFEYHLLKRRLQQSHEPAWSLSPQTLPQVEDTLKDLEQTLPFKLTGDQKKAVKDILNDFTLPRPMNRLIQGDVGSGKTAVALLTAGVVLSQGGQVALMAPTEILAEQHYLNAKKLFGHKLNTALLTGGSTLTERNQVLTQIQSQKPILLIGTHALLEEDVKFSNLVYILIDEQHRFGVEQRRALRKKGGAYYPHALVLTATPIPRTLALTAYGDLQITSIKERPPGRSPILTRVIYGESRQQAYEKIRAELRLGHQTYFVFPLVKESEAEGFDELKSATEEAERLQKEVFPEFKITLLHGQMKSAEKEAAMEEFKSKKSQILVSTTVIEVGVDVPNATVMAIEHAERFGLSQLHQLRGRVGRSTLQSYCYLFTHAKPGESTQARLDALEETNDGFLLAEVDLELRGPGEFMGVRQSGDLPFKMANLVRDRDWLIRAREDVIEILRTDPDLKSLALAPLKHYLEFEGKTAQERLRTS